MSDEPTLYDTMHPSQPVTDPLVVQTYQLGTPLYPHHHSPANDGGEA